MRKARLTKKRSADELGVDELTDDLGVEIDTRPASQRAGSSRQSWPPSDEEDEAVDVDDDNDGDFAPGRRASSRATKKPKRPAGRRRTTADESSEEEAEEEEEEEEEESAGAESSAEDDAGGGEEVEKAGHEVARRGSGGGGGGGGAASSSSSAVAGVRAAKPKKVLSNARLLDATSNSYEVDKILTWRWAQPEVESTTGGGGAAGPGAGAGSAGAAVVDALKAFSQAAESGVDTGQAVGMEVELHGGPREFYVKWAGRSYHHSAWVEEEELKGLAAIKLRYFLKIREMSAAGAVTAEEARLMAKGGDRLEEVVQPDWLKAERVLDR